MSNAKPRQGLPALLAGFFIQSKLTVLVIVLSLLAGVIGVFITPHEEDPSLTVTAADVLIGYPGQGAALVDERVGRVVSAWIKEIATVEHVACSSGDDGAMLIVQFKSGVEKEEALTALYDRLNANAEQLPRGAVTPVVKPRGIDDVPVLAVSFWSERNDPAVLRQIAAEMATKLRGIGNIARVEVTGGEPRAIRVELDAQRLADLGIAADQVIKVIQASNLRLPAGELAGPAGVFHVEAGAFLRSAGDVESLIVGANAGGLIYLRDVARVYEGTADPDKYVSYIGKDSGLAAYPAVTLTATKVRKSDGSKITAEARAVLEKAAKECLPADVHMSVVLDTGLSAGRRVNTMLEHMLIATAIVVLLMLFALGWREASIMAILIPVMLAVVPFFYYLSGFTLNRITLAAMIFAIGFLVDNAIVVMENIHRRFQLDRYGNLREIAVEAVREIGSPTILATFMIIGALLPTAFVTGMTGQYLRPLPIGSSAAMLYSLFIALAVTPYLSLKLLRRRATKERQPAAAGSRKYRYTRALAWIFHDRKRLFLVYTAIILLFAGLVALIPLRIAVFRLFPMTDKDEFSVMIDLPPQATLEETHAVVTEVGHDLMTVPEIAACQIYSGTYGPLNFQGMARHYLMRDKPYQAEIQVQLLPETERGPRSHELCLLTRRVVEKSLAGRQATFTVAEPPPGPPVQATLVMEVYGPEEEGRLALADQVRQIFAATPDVVDVDWSARPGEPIIRFAIDPQKAAARGVAAAQAAVTFRTLLTGDDGNWAHREKENEPTPIAVRLAAARRATRADLESVRFTSLIPGTTVPATDIGAIEEREGSFPFMRKDLDPLVMVTADAIGKGPLYSVIDVTKKLRELKAPDGGDLQILWSDDSKPQGDRYAVRWAGEWTLTYDNMIRDLGLAFLVVIFLIYLTMVAWYDSFAVPIVIMLPIPFVLVGIIPGHLLFGEYITGMSIMGLIALAGIMVRNSILLVDFARNLIRDGRPVKEAVLQASQTRLRPIILTSATVILGDGVLFFDPMLKGLGLTMSIGALASTALTLIIVPMAFYQLMNRIEHRRKGLANC